MLKSLLITMRPKQWTKNLIVFAALVFAEKLLDWALLGRTILAFALLCGLSGCVYLINDLADVERDRQHPSKRQRPLASGKLRPAWAIAATILLLATLIPIAFYLNRYFGLIAAVYLLMMIAYSLSLKNIVIVDVLTIAAGFVLRAVAGAVVIAVPISPWLYVCTTLLALFLGFGKRRQELILLEENADEHRAILKEYTPHLLDEMIAVVTSTAVMAYSLYTFSAPNLPPNHSMMLTIPFVLYGIFRYLYLIHVKNEGGSPEEILISDLPLIVDIALWGIAVVAILYVFKG